MPDDLLAERRDLLDAWCLYCSGATADVRQLTRMTRRGSEIQARGRSDLRSVGRDETVVVLRARDRHPF